MQKLVVNYTKTNNPCPIRGEESSSNHHSSIIILAVISPPFGWPSDSSAQFVHHLTISWGSRICCSQVEKMEVGSQLLLTEIYIGGLGLKY